MILWQLVFMVAIWWIANTLTSVVSKNVMYEESETYEGVTGWTTAFKDLRWLDLTVLQHLIGMVASAACLKVVMKQPLLPEEMPRPAIYMAAVGNVIGNLATNAAYALISSSTTQVIKACEPIFTFGFSILLLSNRESLTLSTLLSIITMITGASIFAVLDTTFNAWGLIAAICSNIAFPVRNIYLKKLSHLWINPFQKYTVISTYSVLLLSPAVVIKFASTQKLLYVNRMENMISSLSHVAYNVASIGVLQNVSPLTHAIFNLTKRVFVIFVNIAYFHTSLSLSMSIGLLVFFVGLFFYYKIVAGDANSQTNLTRRSLVLIFLLILTACFSGLYLSAQHSQDLPTKTQCVHTSRSELKIFTAWIFERPIPHGVIYNVQVMSHHNPDIPIHVFCGSSQCVHAVSNLNRTNVKAEFLVISDLVKDTPLEQWLARHPLNKVLSGPKFESHLQVAVQLSILQRYGGIYVDPMLRIFGDVVEATNCSAWIIKRPVSDKSLEVSYFPKEHQFIYDLAILFVREYSKGALQFDFSKVVRDAYFSCRRSNTCPKSLTIHTKRLTIDEDLPEGRHFGTLSYNSRIQETGNANLGDEIQGFPGLQFLPFVDNFVERDALTTSASNHQVSIFFNAWWGSRQSDWPPPCNIDPIMTSVHIHSSVQKSWAKHIDYLKSRSPIGCRDYFTLDFLTSHGVDAYFSGCLTVLTKNPSIEKGNSDTIYLVDVKEEFIRMLPSQVQEKAFIIHHKMEGKGKMVSLERFSAAYQLIEKYASAKLVITQRIHCALPCVGMGTPVIFINSPKLPGGGGSKKESSDRTGGLLPLFHTLDLYSLSADGAVEWLTNFPWDNPPPNPNVDLMMRLRATAWNVIRQHQVFYDTAHKFGLIPMSPPAVMADESQPLFHLIMSTSKNTSKLFNHGCKVCSLKDVVTWRSIESIFHHHPFAKVIVHSNTILQSDFAVLTEAGYSIEVTSYDMLKLLEDAHTQSLVNKSKTFQQFNQSERDLLRTLILYNWGGIYMDTDIILVRPIDTLGTNILAWQDSKNTTISTSFMKFQKGNTYLNTYLAMINDSGLFSGNYEANILTKMLDENPRQVTALSSSTFYFLHNKDVNEDCVSTKMDKHFVNSYQEKAYGFQLNSKNVTGVNVMKLREGTLCKQLLNAYCVLCNKQY